MLWCGVVAANISRTSRLDDDEENAIKVVSLQFDLPACLLCFDKTVLLLFS